MKRFPEPFRATHHEDEGGVDLVICSGELDLVSAERLHAALEGARGSRLVIDLTDVSFIDSTGLSILIMASRKYPDGELRICGPSREVRRVFEVTGFAELLPISGTRADAMAALVRDHQDIVRG